MIANNSRMWDYFEGRRGHPAALNSRLFEIARTLVRAADERAKPNGERLPEFRDSARDSLELRLFSAEPIYADLETLTLADSLTDFAGAFGDGDPLVQGVLNGKSPRVRAAELVNGSQLKDVAARKALYEGGAAAVAASKDPDDRAGPRGGRHRPRGAQALRVAG